MIQSIPIRPAMHLGVHLDGVAAQIAKKTSLAKPGLEIEETQYRSSRTPPAALVPLNGDERILIDAAWPPHPRGMGRDWPPEARFSSSYGVGRFPLAFAWRLIRNQRDWEWRRQGHNSPITPYAAIGSAISNLTEDERSSKPVLVIPNFTDLLTQQRIIEQATTQHGGVRLLWRPIAAALTWWETLSEGERQRIVPNGIDQVPFVVAYLGVDFLEVTLLHLKRDAASSRILPARERPSVFELAESPAIPALVNAAVASLHEDIDPTDQSVWRLLWTTSFVRDVFSHLRIGGDRSVTDNSWTHEATLDHELIRRSWNSALRGSSSPLAETICRTWDRFMPCSSRSDDGKWKRELKRIWSTDRPQYGILCGPLAPLPDRDGGPMGESLIHELAPSVQRTWLEGRNLPDGVLSRGAAIYAERQSVGLPTYLDKLPRLRLQVTRKGQAEWLDLLDSGEFVHGGKPWKKSDYDFDLAVKEGSTDLPLAVDHEEFDHVRKLEVKLPKKTTRSEQVRLHVEIEPAQGNARVYVRPVNLDAFGRSQVLVNWGSMSTARDESGQPLTPSAYLKTLPLAFPKHQPRLCSENRWRITRDRIRDWKTMRTPRMFNKVAAALKAKDQLAYPNEATAVSSDGLVDPPSQAPVLEEFVEYLLNDLKQPSFIHREVESHVRLLGYTSTASPEHLRRLLKELRSRGRSLSPAFLMSCGWCLRDPSAIHAFADAVLARFSYSHSGLNNWLKAFAEVLRYREHATEDIASSVCSELTEHVLAIFNEERRGRQRPIVFRNAAMVIVYLLRRRAYDDSYLAPDSDLAIRVKNSYREAIDDLNKGKLYTIGGTVNLRETLQNMIDYVDKKGTGLVYNAAADEDEDDDDDQN